MYPRMRITWFVPRPSYKCNVSASSAVSSKPSLVLSTNPSRASSDVSGVMVSSWLRQIFWPRHRSAYRQTRLVDAPPSRGGSHHRADEPYRQIVLGPSDK